MGRHKSPDRNPIDRFHSGRQPGARATGRPHRAAAAAACGRGGRQHHFCRQHQQRHQPTTTTHRPHTQQNRCCRSSHEQRRASRLSTISNKHDTSPNLSWRYLVGAWNRPSRNESSIVIMLCQIAASSQMEWDNTIDGKPLDEAIFTHAQANIKPPFLTPTTEYDLFRRPREAHSSNCPLPSSNPAAGVGTQDWSMARANRHFQGGTLQLSMPTTPVRPNFGGPHALCPSRPCRPALCPAPK